MINQKIFEVATKNKAAAKLLAHLSALPPERGMVDELAQLVRRAGALVLKRPNASDRIKRDTFVLELRSYLDSSVTSVDLTAFDAALEFILVSEDGHHRILRWLARCPFSAEPADMRAAAVIARMEANLALLLAESRATLEAAGTMAISGGPELRDASGRNVSEDSMIFGMVRSLIRPLPTVRAPKNAFAIDPKLLKSTTFPSFTPSMIVCLERNHLKNSCEC